MGRSITFIKKLVYYFLLKNFLRLKHLKLYHYLWNRIIIPTYDVRINLHGTKVILPSTYTYPIICRQYPAFNNPYLQLVHEVFLSKQKKLIIADVGAAVGDGFVMLTQNIPEAINKIYCVEGSDFFIKYLSQNCTSAAVVIHSVISDNVKSKALIHNHASSASAQGIEQTNTQTLDEILYEKNQEIIDVLKIDVDGSDGRVLNGAGKILSYHKPVVIFEFHPKLLRLTGNSLLQPFETFSRLNYKHCIWFDKYGKYSHTSASNDMVTINKYIEICLRAGQLKDIHFDVIAIPLQFDINIESLAKCEFANNKKYPY